MPDDAGAVERIAFLTRSKPRVEILTHLLESGPTTQREFREHVDASRSTVTRALAALEEYDWVRRDGEAYRLTPQGRIVADGLCDLVDTVRATEEIATFIEWFPYAEHDLDLEHLRGAEITASTDTDPYAPLRKHASAVRDASEFRMLLPSIDLRTARSTKDRVLNDDLELELIVSPDVEATISSEEFAPVLREQVAAGGLTVFVSEEAVPFYLGLSDTGSVQVGVEDDEGYPRALLETDCEEVRGWAESVYDEYRDHARVKPAEEF